MDHRAGGDSVRSLRDSTTRAMKEILEGRLTGISGLLPFAGPAVVVSVVYMDPGNFATNIQAAAGYGYALLWVVVLSNIIPMLFPALFPKLWVFPGLHLPEPLPQPLPTPPLP